MASRDNKQLIRRLYEAYAAGPDAVEDFFAPEYVDHSVFGDLHGLKSILGAFHDAFPNATWKVQDLIAEGDKVVARAIIEIRTAGGVQRIIGSTAIYRIDKGKVVEQWGHGDPLF